MGAATSRIWSDLCAIESDQVRARMLDTLLASPELVETAQEIGIYGPIMAWRTQMARGARPPWPWSKSKVSHQPTRSPGTQIMVSPAAKALDYFQEALALLGISETEPLTHERVKTAFKKTSLRVHPDKGGTPEAFDEVTRAFQYLGKILDRISPKTTAAEKARMTASVNPETAAAMRVPMVQDGPPVTLSAKKLDMNTFNKLFEENRLPDPDQETGYGDWLKSTGAEESASDPRLKGKFNQQVFEQVFREKASAQRTTAITRRLEPDYIVPVGGTELGAKTDNFTAALGSDVQFTDLKQAYGESATIYQQVASEVANVRERSATTMAEARRIRNEEMARVVPDEMTRISAAAAAVEERERQRRLRLAKQDTTFEAWSDSIKRRLLVNNT
jgi:curved DNA-binding protein CbpA